MRVVAKLAKHGARRQANKLEHRVLSAQVASQEAPEPSAVRPRAQHTIAMATRGLKAAITDRQRSARLGRVEELGVSDRNLGCGKSSVGFVLHPPATERTIGPELRWRGEEG